VASYSGLIALPGVGGGGQTGMIGDYAVDISIISRLKSSA
jgi:hypothetical protein